MARYGLMFMTLMVATVAYLYSSILSQPKHVPDYVPGKNATVLFISNREHGLSNVHIASAQALLEHHPDVDVHYASFAGPTEEKLKRVAAQVRQRKSSSRDITFHEIHGPSFQHATGWYQDDEAAKMVGPPALAGLPELLYIIERFQAWNGEDHMKLYRHIGEIIENVDPAVVVLDTLLGPAIDATRRGRRRHMFISPNTLAENFAAVQPYGKGLWKYPALGSGFAYPVPWRKMAENIYLNYRLFKAILWSSRLQEIKDAGVEDPSSLISMHRDDVPWITMNTAGAALPIEVVPANVTGVGPILLSSAPAIEQDRELVQWASKADTILISLGSFFKYSKSFAMPMAEAISELLSKSEGRVQVLWKAQLKDGIPDEFMAMLQPHIDSDQLRMTTWLKVDPAALLESGAIDVSVHHGGSNCYHEAVWAGVPHIILPFWADLYTFASLVETMGIGIWGCKGSSPMWTKDGLLQAMAYALKDGSGNSLRRKAKRLGEEVRARGPGRELAAREIVKLAYHT